MKCKLNLTLFFLFRFHSAPLSQQLDNFDPACCLSLLFKLLLYLIHLPLPKNNNCSYNNKARGAFFRCHLPLRQSSHPMQQPQQHRANDGRTNMLRSKSRSSLASNDTTVNQIGGRKQQFWNFYLTVAKTKKQDFKSKPEGSSSRNSKQQNDHVIVNNISA